MPRQAFLPRLLALLLIPAALALVVAAEWLAGGGQAMSSERGMGFGVLTLFLVPPFVISVVTLPLSWWLLRDAPVRRLLLFSGTVLLGYVGSTALLGWLITAVLWPLRGGLADTLTFYCLPFAPIVLALTASHILWGSRTSPMAEPAPDSVTPSPEPPCPPPPTVTSPTVTTAE